MLRLFVAVWLPQEVLNRLAVLPRPEVDGLRWTDQDHWHVTLRFLGPVDDLEPVRAALAGVASAAGGSVGAVLGPAVDRFSQRVLHVPVAGLDGIAAAVVQSTAHLGKRPDDRPFNGHVTLARAARDAKVDLRSLIGTAVAAEWDVEELCLMESRLSPKGARYAVLERFPLALPAACPGPSPGVPWAGP